MPTSSSSPEIHGFADGAFAAVRAEFERNFAERGDVGAAVAVYARGEPVVDLWAGDARPGQPWAEDTLTPVFSTTKGPTTLAIQVLADRGVIDLDAPVAEYWPEFAQAGKASITLTDVLAHRSGVITVDDYEEFLDIPDIWTSYDLIAERLAKTAPLWEPGTRHGYHALTLGWIAAEVVRRATGRSLGTVFREEVAEPLGADFWIGLPDEHHARVADLRDAPPPTDPRVKMYLAMFNSSTWTGRAHFVGPGGVGAVAGTFNSALVRRAEIPAGGGIGAARGLARLYGLLATGGGDLVSPETIDHFTKERVRGADAVLIMETRYGLGYARPTKLLPMGPNDEAFGHGGLGGSVAFGDPVAGIGFAYTPNQLLFPRLDETTRARALMDAVYA